MGIIFPCEILQALKINKFYEEWHKCPQQKILFKLNPSSRKQILIHEPLINLYFYSLTLDL